MEWLTTDNLPVDLREENYQYPDELFLDWTKKSWEKEEKVLQFDGGEPMLPPVTNSERILLMARYAIVEKLDLPGSRHIKLARCEVEMGFNAGIRKVWWSCYKSYDGLEEGDIELAAEELGVYEIVFPFDQEQMQEEAEHVSHQFAVA